MNDKSIAEQHAQVDDFVKQRRLNEGLAQLEACMSECNNYYMSEELAGIKTSYQYMLQYMLQGASDPGRRDMFHKLMAQTLELNDRVRISRLDASSTKLFHQNRRTYILSGSTPSMEQIADCIEAYGEDLALASLMSPQKRREIIERYETALKDMFMTTWCNAQWSSADADTALRLLRSERASIEALCLLVSAVTLSLAECFDARKLSWIMSAYEHEDSHINQRALAGFVITVLNFDERLYLYPAIQSQIEELWSEGKLSKDVPRIYLQMLQCVETKNVDRKMRDDIIPNIMKKRGNMLRDRFKNGGKDTDKTVKFSPLSLMDEDDDELDSLMREMNDLQTEGADLQMSTLSHLKDFVFFREMHHWFYPFERTQKDVDKAYSEKINGLQLIDTVLSTGMFCDSDKYSIFFLMSANASQCDMILGELVNGEEMPGEEEKDIVKRIESNPKRICNCYLHDLYRFFKLYPFRREFNDVFSEHMMLHHTITLMDRIGNEEDLMPVADFMMKKEYWKEAADLYNEINLMSGGEAGNKVDFLRKEGYVLQKSKAYDEALKVYQKANIIEPDTPWIEKRLATCYRMTGAYEEALEMYLKIDEKDGGSASNTYYTGICQMELNRYDEALNTFFRLDFDESNSVRAWRGIAWCSFLADKLEQAMRYYNKVIEAKPGIDDYMNAGHVAWCMGDIKQAVSLYRKVAAMVDNKDQLSIMFEEDCFYLVMKGIDDDDIALMTDLL